MTNHQETENKVNGEATKSKYLKEEQLKLIIKYQNEIYERTQILISTRKIIHELITEDNLNKIKKKYIDLLCS